MSKKKNVYPSFFKFVILTMIKVLCMGNFLSNNDSILKNKNIFIKLIHYSTRLESKNKPNSEL